LTTTGQRRVQTAGAAAEIAATAALHLPGFIDREGCDGRRITIHLRLQHPGVE
jgi:hypothetical protein